MDATKRKLIIIGGILLSVLIMSAVTVLVLESHSGHLLCLPTKDLAKFDPNALKNVPSDDKTTLIGFFAYLEFNSEHGEQQYSCLQTEPSGSVWVDLDARNRQRLWINETCSQLVFNFDKRDHTNHIRSIKVGPSEKSIAKACATKDSGIYFDEDEAYHCFATFKFPCYELKDNPNEAQEEELSHKKMADLVFKALRFEMNGDPRKISKGQFSKPVHYCF